MLSSMLTHKVISTSKGIFIRGLATSPLSSSSSSSPSSTSSKFSKANLELKSGEKFEGKSFGGNEGVSGELVFSTGLVGYPESMTDPSYRGQILVFTQPLIGNYGVPGTERDEFGLLKYFESERIQVSGIVVSNYSAKYSHWEAVESLGEWCGRYNVPAISEIDTRALTKLLRERGSTVGRILLPETDLKAMKLGKLPEFIDPNASNLVAEVSTKSKKIFNEGKGDVVIGLLDCGVKNNIIRSLAKRGAEVHLLPWDTDLSKEKENFDGLFISNGPGDPSTCQIAIDNLSHFIHQSEIPPVFGICMGNLLLGKAAGASTYKLKHGNRGHNQPALNLITGKGVITSQNHGYAVKESTLPEGWEAFFRNVNDGSNEGLIHKSKPISSVQFHPEYMGGPKDSEYLFDSFLQQVRSHKYQQPQSDQDELPLKSAAL